MLVVARDERFVHEWYLRTGSAELMNELRMVVLLEQALQKDSTDVKNVYCIGNIEQ